MKAVVTRVSEKYNRDDKVRPVFSHVTDVIAQISRTTMCNAVTYALDALETRRFLSAGQLDFTFGTGGIVTDLTLPAVAAMVVQTDGKVVEVGQMLNNFEVARFNANGSPDTTFGYFGRLVTDFGRTETPSGVVIQPDGKVVVAGLSEGASGPGLFDYVGKFALARYLAKGQLDNSFGSDGLVTTSFGPGERVASAHVGLQADGRIVMAGTGYGMHNGDDLLLARYNTDGSPDATFGTGGSVINLVGSPRINGMAVQADNKIVVIGYGGAQGFVRRFNADGTADPTTFAGDGGVQSVDAIAIQPDGKILLGSAFYPEVVAPVIRDNPDGTADSTLNSNTFTTGARVLPTGFVLQPDGKIIAAGIPTYIPDRGPASVERLNSDGSIDLTFGYAGAIDTSPFGLADPLIAAGPAGTTVLAGGPGTHFVLGRLTGDGTVTPPTGASISGTVYNDTNANGFRDNAEAPVAGRQVYLDLNGIGDFANGDPISTTDASGQYSFANLTPKNYLVRLVPQNGLAITAPLFGGKYFVQLGQNQAVTGDDFGTQAISSPSFPLPDGQLLAAGSANGHNTLTRYNADGSIDVSFGALGLVTLPNSAAGTPSNALVQPGGRIFITYPTAIVILNNAGAILRIVLVPQIGSTISGTIYYDTNSNAVRDTGEQGVPGRKVYLDLEGLGHQVPADPATITDSNGNYSFSGLAPANYIVRAQEGSVLTAPLFGGFHWVPFGSGPAVVGQDFGVQSVGSASVRLPDGKLAVETTLSNAGPFGVGTGVTRFNADGSTDLTFGVGGSVEIDANAGPEVAVALLSLLPNGNLVATLDTIRGPFIALISPSGSLLSSISTAAGAFLQKGIAVQPDNKFLLVSAHLPNIIFRVNANLTIDTTFGTGGIVTLPGFGVYPVIFTVLPDGTILVTYNSGSFLISPNGTIL